MKSIESYHILIQSWLLYVKICEERVQTLLLIQDTDNQVNAVKKLKTTEKCYEEYYFDY